MSVRVGRAAEASGAPRPTAREARGVAAEARGHLVRVRVRVRVRRKVRVRVRVRVRVSTPPATPE